MKKKLNKKGFSLVELIVCIAILAVLVGLIAPALISNIEKSRESKDLQTLDTIAAAIQYALADEAANKAARGLKNGYHKLSDMNNKVTQDAVEIDITKFNALVREYLKKDATGEMKFDFESGSASGKTVWYSLDNDTVTVVITAGDEPNYPTKSLNDSNVAKGSKSKKPFIVTR